MTTAKLLVARNGYWWSGNHQGPAYSPSDPGDFVLGVTKPDATNTGYAPGTTFTQVTSDLTVTADGAVYKDVQFTGGKVYVQAKNVTFDNCWFVGRARDGADNEPFVRCHWDSAQNVLFDRCTFGHASQVGVPDTAILGRSFTAHRCDISRATDGIRNVNVDTASNLGDITIEGCYVHDLLYVSPDSQHSDNQSHNDCLQIQGGLNVVVRGNTLRAYVDPNLGGATDPTTPLFDSTDASSGGLPVTGDPYAWMTALIVTPNNGDVGDVTIDQNWLEGGSFTVNIATKPDHNVVAPGIAVTNNRFGQDTRIGGYDFIVRNAIQSLVTSSGNIFPDGSSVPMSNGG